MNYYLSFKQYLKKKHNTAIWRLPLSTGYPCPNRLDEDEGCTFCDGSSFIAPYMKENSNDLDSQIKAGIEFFGNKYKVDYFYGYFQENTGTYGDLDDLLGKYEKVLSHEKVKGLIISTRPDCIDEAVIRGIQEMNARYAKKETWIELGLQTIYDDTLLRINRNHTYGDFKQAVRTIKTFSDCKIGVHMIIGLPGETPERIEKGLIQLFRENELDGLKLRLLDILPGTVIKKDYDDNPTDFYKFSNSEYITLICNVFERIPPDVVILRTLNYNPVNVLNIDDRLLTKDEILIAMRKEFEKRSTYQGCFFSAR